ncbi:alginate export family protein [Actomonas aquatica]|uniref:Alginate export family protein n=1 Tax=Actomonas aquatica TaxID=2866162 RepID=A0ABZ1CFG4_9BACT|nr:alginate export family protein [Opitutus sp. WL0086]WRQ89025.1 alginate export family protein [Opitutus sp. WL0086]
MTKLCPKISMCGLAAFVLAAATAPAASTLDEVFSEGKVSLASRLRYEYGDQPGVNDSTAFTFRNRLGFTSGKFNGWSFMIEGENVHAFDPDAYNQAGLNPGGAGQVVIADVEGTEVNQAFLAYAGESVSGKLGRQRIVVDNVRFIGDVGWRQDQQTYDAFTVSGSPTPELKLTYGYLWQINRIFGDARDWESDSHFLSAGYKVGSGTLAGYAYLLDFDNAAANSSATYGASYNGTVKIDDTTSILYRLEAATQSDYGNSPFDYTATYYVGELGAKFGKVTAKIGYEVLGAGNGQGFKTPLATLHAFNGFADLFLGTPGTGLEDFYVSVGGPIVGVNVTAFYHDFSAESGGADYGSEIDLVVAKKFAQRFTAIAKFASFESDGFARDTDRFSVELNFAY